MSSKLTKSRHLHESSLYLVPVDDDDNDIDDDDVDDNDDDDDDDGDDDDNILETDDNETSPLTRAAVEKPLGPQKCRS